MTKDQLKQIFKTGAIPTQANFASLIDFIPEGGTGESNKSSIRNVLVSNNDPIRSYYIQYMYEPENAVNIPIYVCKFEFNRQSNDLPGIFQYSMVTVNEVNQFINEELDCIKSTDVSLSDFCDNLVFLNNYNLSTRVINGNSGITAHIKGVFIDLVWYAVSATLITCDIGSQNYTIAELKKPSSTMFLDDERMDNSDETSLMQTIMAWGLSK